MEVLTRPPGSLATVAPSQARVQDAEGQRHATIRRVLRVATALLVLCFYGEVLAHAPVTGQDFRVFYSAAAVIRQGGSPYDTSALVRAEERLFPARSAAERRDRHANPYIQGPLLALLFVPFLRFPPPVVYDAYAAVLLAAAAVALLVMDRVRRDGGGVGPRTMRRAFPLLLSPVVFLAVLLGQPDPLLLLLFALAWHALQCRHATLASALLAVACVKPQIMAGPIVLLAVLAWRAGNIRPYLGGLLAGVTAVIGCCLLLAGPLTTGDWLRALVSFGGATVYAQVDIAALSTLYLDWLPRALVPVAVVGAVAAWIMWCAFSARRGTFDAPATLRWVSQGLCLWLLATPYAHPHDDVLLLPALWLRATAQPATSGRALRALFAATWWVLPLTSVLGLRPPIVRGLGVVPVIFLALMILVRCGPSAPVTSQSRRHRTAAIRAVRRY
jgi:hypothetical protein